MDHLMAKLKNLTTEAPAKAAQKTAAAGKPAGKKPFKKYNSGNRGNAKRDDARNSKNVNKEARNNQRSKKRESKAAPRTVSKYDRLRNKDGSKKDRVLNAKGQKFVSDATSKASYVARKTSEQAQIDLVSPRESLHQFYGRIVATGANATVVQLSRSELELSKDKMGYDTSSRVLRALEQITQKRGFKLNDTAKSDFQILPATKHIYPYANGQMPSSLMRPNASLSQMKITREELLSVFSKVVFGHRDLIQFDPAAKYKTKQLRLNAQVVANSLNNNPQLQVDSLAQNLAPVLVGQAAIKDLPKPVLAPKKI